MSSEKRIDSLTGIRGMAALLVIYAHLTDNGFFSIHPLHPGEIGVMVFFTLSGFLMAFLYGDKPFNSTAAIRYGISRFSRIAPAYLAVVLVSYLIYNLVDGQFIYAIDNHNLLRHLLFSGNVSALWSIPPEVQFYAVFVGLWFALWRFKSQGNAGMFAMMLGAIFVLISFRADLPGTFVGSTMQYFFSGVVFGLLRSKVSASKGAGMFVLLQVAVIALIGLVLTGFIHLEVGDKRSLYNHLEAALFSGIFVFLFSFNTGLGKALFSNRLMMLCGECSFSLYLLNLPVIYVGLKLMGNNFHTPTMAMLIAFSVVVLAVFMYRWVELPGSALFRRVATRLLDVSRPSVGVPVASAVVVPADAGVIK